MFIWLTFSSLLVSTPSHPGVCSEDTTGESAIKLIDAGINAQPSRVLRSTEGSYSSNWEQKQSGSDFRDEVLESLRDSGYRLERSKAIVIDDRFESGSHGAATTNEFKENSSMLEIDELFEWEDLRNPSFANRIRSRNLQGVTVNISYSTGADENIYNSLEALADAGADLIISSGNRSNEPMSTNTIKLAREGKAIVVGAHNMEGLSSHYSQHKGVVHLTAGVGREIEIDRGDGQFGQSDWGTSYSAPQVAGAWADLRAILPNASRQELLNLIQATSIKTLGVQGGDSRHGAGALNVVKLLSVAKKIRMGESSPYNTGKESQEAFRAARKLDAQGDVSAALDAYRKSFLLGQFTEEGEASRRRLVELMKSQGLDREARYYESLSPDTNKREEFLTRALESSDEFVRRAAEASLEGFKEQDRDQYVANAIQSDSPAVLSFAVSQIYEREGAVPQLESLLPKVGSLSTRAQLELYASALESDQFTERLKHHFQNAKAPLAKQFASAGRVALDSPPSERKNVFRDELYKEASSSSSPELWRYFLRTEKGAENRARQLSQIQDLSSPELSSLFVDEVSISEQDRRRLKLIVNMPGGVDIDIFLADYFALDSEPDRSRLLQEFQNRAKAAPKAKL
jgi:pSer/pThr/pTyr-binding forkhead associated (FHA) protein